MPKLKVGDIVVVSSLSGEKEFKVIQVKGDIAITKYRDFDVEIVNGWLVFEHGQHNSDSQNTYFVKEH